MTTIRTNDKYSDKRFGQMTNNSDKQLGQTIRTNNLDKLFGQMIRTNDSNKQFGQIGGKKLERKRKEKRQKVRFHQGPKKRKKSF
jgi:hypothetical protein